MRVIFLDIDGVLNSEAHALKLEKSKGANRISTEKSKIDREAVSLLNRLVEVTGAKIVVSSTWRKLFDTDELQRILCEHGLVGEIVGKTPDGYKDPEVQETFGHGTRILRGHEIEFWLREHPEVERFVILDDDSDMAMHKSRLVQTDCKEGLRAKHVEHAIRMLAWDGRSGCGGTSWEHEALSPDYVAWLRQTVAAETRRTLYEAGLESDLEQISTVIADRTAQQITAAGAVNCGSSWGIDCHEEGCVEKLVLSRTTATAPSHEDDYEHLGPALDQAAVSLGWGLHQCVWRCPAHSPGKILNALHGTIAAMTRKFEK